MSKEKVYQGIVKSYNEKKGYGFIAREDNQGDLFFHVSDLVDRNHNPQQNDEVEFEVAEGRKGRQKATQVKRVVE
ncbi:putative cold shock protein A [subsurface metagenome]